MPAYTRVLRSIVLKARWPLDHLIPTYEGCFGKTEWPILTIVSILLLTTLLSTFCVWRATTAPAIAQHQRRHLLLFIISSNITTFIMMPSAMAFASTVRSYALIMLAVIRTTKMLGSQKASRVRLHYVHLDFSLQTVLLPGLWQILIDAVLSSEDGEAVALLVFFLIGGSIWVAYPIAYMSKTNKRIQESKDTGLKAKLQFQQHRVALLFIYLDLFLLLIFQFA